MSHFKLSIMLCFTVLFALPALQSSAEGGNQYQTRVEILNKASLSPEKLADALYVKASLDGSDKAALLRQAARLNPSDPVYYYRMYPQGLDAMAMDMAQIPGVLLADSKEREQVEAESRKAWRVARLALEKSLAVDPNYLPSLYAYAMTKPTYEQKMQGLQRIASVCPDNAEPYYVMADLACREATKDKKGAGKESDYTAFDMTDAQWNGVLDLLRKGNSCPVLRITMARAPSVRDVRVTTCGKAWPEAATTNLLWMAMIDLGPSPFPCVPGTTNAAVRQIARQASWEARKAYWRGDRHKALEMIHVVREFTTRMTTSQPYGLVRLLTGRCASSIVTSAEVQILQIPPDRTRLLQMHQEKVRWNRMMREDAQAVLKASTVTVKDIMLSPKQPLMYPDHAVESAGVEKMLRKVELVK